MPRKADPLPVNVANWNKNLLKRAHKQTFMDLLVSLDAVADMETRGEISSFAAVMQNLDYFYHVRNDRTFSEAGWQDLLARFPDGAVTIPAHWISILLTAWRLYVDPNDPVPFEKAAGLAGEGKSRKASTKVPELIEKYHLARMVAQHKFDALSDGEILSDEEAIGRVYNDLEEFPEAKRSEAKIKKAWERWEKFIEYHAAIATADLPDTLP